MNSRPSSDEVFDVAIAGGGIVGCACALACAQRGLRVVLVERDVLGSGATAAGMGHVVVMDDSDAQFALTRYSQLLWNGLKLPPAAEAVQVGTLWIAADAEEMAGAESKLALYRERDVPCRILTAAQLATEEPHLTSGLAGGLLVPEDSAVYPPVVALELARRAEALGAKLIVGRAVRSLGEGRVRLDDGTAAPAGLHVISTSRMNVVVDITIHEGKNRQVRRMFETLGHRVEALTRMRFGPVALGDLGAGAVRAATEKEVRELQAVRRTAESVRAE